MITFMPQQETSEYVQSNSLFLSHRHAVRRSAYGVKSDGHQAGTTVARGAAGTIVALPPAEPQAA
ncbi:MAG TPA: hypothetical protein DCQ64_21210, partial [Candidatus Rokubacteria bacterium]|nr:hypothetical protein [Candidatus Rokubacteria bacterium]